MWGWFVGDGLAILSAERGCVILASLRKDLENAILGWTPSEWMSELTKQEHSQDAANRSILQRFFYFRVKNIKHWDVRKARYLAPQFGVKRVTLGDIRIAIAPSLFYNF